MPVSPQDFALWARATGNQYPRTAEEKARLAPEVYDYNRGFGKFRGFDEFQGFQGDVVYDQPQSVRHYGDNSLLQSPITPDNNVPKVAGQLNSSLTGQYYTRNRADDAVETGYGGTGQPRSLLEKAALGGLAVGAAAAGLYGARKATGRDLGVGKVGGMMRDLGRRAKSSVKSALGRVDDAGGATVATRQGVEEAVAAAQYGASALDDVAPGIVREQNVVPVGMRAQQQAKSQIPDPWGESVLTQGGQVASSPATQSVIPTQTSGTGVDPDISERVAAFTQKLGKYETPITTAPVSQGQSAVTPSSVSVMGRFPGAEGSSAAGVTFTPVQGAIEGRPARYTVLPTEPRVGETITEFVQRPVKIDGRWTTKYDPVSVFQNPIEEGAQEAAQLTGLLAPQRPLPQGSLSGVQRTFSADPRIATVQRQAENIFQATGDPGVIRGAYSGAPALPIRVNLPSGETVPTGSLYEAFGQTVNPQTGVPITASREQSLQAALNMQSIMKERALMQLGVPTTYQPSQAELAGLAGSTKKLLRTTAEAAEDAQNRLAYAKANELLYKLKPEITEGIREVPVISQASGEVVGSRVVPETQGLPTGEFYKMRARGGAGRQETGGIGRRREAVEAMEGLGFNVAQGSMEDVSPVLYKVIDDATGQSVVVQPGEVSPMQLLTGAATPVRGTAVEPQRVMGREGRTYKGVQSSVIDPGSFDPAMMSQIAEVSPERIDPTTGLAYSVQAMGGKERAAMAAEQEALRRAGKYKESIRLGKQMAQPEPRVAPGAREGSMFTNMSNEQLNETILQARNAGMLDVEQAAANVLEARSNVKEQAALFKQRSDMVRKILRGETL